MATKKRAGRPKRKIVRDPSNPKGRRLMSEKSIGVTNPRINKGKPTNIPSVFGGKIRSQREAESRIIKAGGIDPENPQRGKLKSFPSFKRANKAAKARSKSFDKSRSLDLLKARLKGKTKKKSTRSRK